MGKSNDDAQVADGQAVKKADERWIDQEDAKEAKRRAKAERARREAKAKARVKAKGKRKDKPGQKQEAMCQPEPITESDGEEDETGSKDRCTTVSTADTDVAPISVLDVLEQTELVSAEAEDE